MNFVITVAFVGFEGFFVRNDHVISGSFFSSVYLIPDRVLCVSMISTCLNEL